jgi:hypothetical protein
MFCLSDETSTISAGMRICIWSSSHACLHTSRLSPIEVGKGLSSNETHVTDMFATDDPGEMPENLPNTCHWHVGKGRKRSQSFTRVFARVWLVTNGGHCCAWPQLVDILELLYFAYCLCSDNSLAAAVHMPLSMPTVIISCMPWHTAAVFCNEG